MRPVAFEWPSRAITRGVFEQRIRYVKGFADVWFCTKGDNGGNGD